MILPRLENITVVIRTANERTIEACKNIVLGEVAVENIHIIEEIPFSAAVRKTFEIGLKSGKDWTLAVDADLLLIPGCISVMIKNATIYSDKLYMYQGHILDKFRMSVKYGGPHLYATKNLKKASDYYEEMEKELRPETFINKRMVNLGFKVITDNKLYALHDFHQFYKDIYRKSFFHGIKHTQWKSLLPSWMDNSNIDHDYTIAVIGFIDGFYSISRSYPSIDSLYSKFENKIETILSLSEKEDFDINYNFDFEKTIWDLGYSFTPELIFSRNSNSIGGGIFQKVIRKFMRFSYTTP